MQMLIVTTDEVPGRVTNKTLGLVSGWGEATRYGQSEESRHERSRKAAFASITEEAEELGADAVVALRFSFSISEDGHHTFYAFGTAVKLV